MKLHTKMLFFSAALIVATGLGCAGKGGLSAGAATLDADKDGKISRSEFLARYQAKDKAQTLFNRLDASGDGFLDRDETGSYPDDYWTKTETNAEP
jgi:Ca2+-binding EF-hand superfamily protein